MNSFSSTELLLIEGLFSYWPHFLLGFELLGVEGIVFSDVAVPWQLIPVKTALVHLWSIWTEEKGEAPLCWFQPL